MYYQSYIVYLYWFMMIFEAEQCNIIPLWLFIHLSIKLMGCICPRIYGYYYTSGITV